MLGKSVKDKVRWSASYIAKIIVDDNVMNSTKWSVWDSVRGSIGNNIDDNVYSYIREQGWT